MRPGPRQPLIATSLRDLQPLGLQRVEQQEETQLWNEFIERHHYLGYRQPLGPHLRYFLLDQHGRRLGCVLFSQATHSLACRDEWVGWPAGQYKKHLDLVVGQPRFLLFPWVQVPNLASHALGLAARQLPTDWQRRYGTRPVLLETFCETPRFRGTCYRAANWIHLGQTVGRGKLDTHNQYALPIKDIFVKPLCADWKAVLNRWPLTRLLRPARTLTGA